jgi:uncharacterized protein (DUF1684 family)
VRARALLALGLAVRAVAAEEAAAPSVDAAYAAEIAAFRAEREGRLRAPDGWLTLAGLHWLEPGESSFGSAEDNAVVLPPAGVPARAGTFVLQDGKVTLRPVAGAVLLDGEPAAERLLRDDTAEGGPDVLQVGRLRLHVIRREERIGLRIKDPEHPRLASFQGLDYFPLDPSYRVEARLEPYEKPRDLTIATVLGTTSKAQAPGLVKFTLHGQEHALVALAEPGATELWFIFKDATSGKESYGFRYLYAPFTGQRVDLDFNRSYNPPCAFSPHATCPLPPPENGLAVRIAAGERAYSGHE